MTVRGGEGGVNPYGQPDRKKTVIFFDDFPKSLCSFYAKSGTNTNAICVNLIHIYTLCVKVAQILMQYVYV